MSKLVWASVLALVSCAAPAMAQECGDAVTMLDQIVEHGYQITFGDSSGEWTLFLVENGTGRWLLIAIKGDALCIAAAGMNGVHVPNV